MKTVQTSNKVVTLIAAVCSIAGDQAMIAHAREGMAALGLRRAVQAHDSEALYEWLMKTMSFQGVSDLAAATYMRQHGDVEGAIVTEAVEASTCPKLSSYWHFESCGFHKGSRTCCEPEHFTGCGLPDLDLRNGRLNQSAFALRLFFRDVADEDIVEWIDVRLASAAGEAPGQATRAQRMRLALLSPLGNVHGLSSKVWSMALADLLMGADPEREAWVETGASMVAIDTLVHNWLHRTGILNDLNAGHAYGPRCYAAGGCADIIEHFARQIDARQFNAEYPAFFPRFVQKAIWRFCAQAGHDRCNGNRIDDSHSCSVDDCELGYLCQRVPLYGDRVRVP